MEKQVIALATDEAHVVMWDIDALLADTAGRTATAVDTARLISHEWLTLDAAYAMKTDVTAPILLLELPGRRLFVADGNHRLYRAVQEHVPSMNVIVIPQEEHLRYLYRSSAELFELVVEGLAEEGVFISDFREG